MQINTKKLKKLIITNLPYVIFAYAGDLIGYAYRIAEGNGFQEKLLPFMSNLGVAFAKVFPSFHPSDILFGLALAGVMRLVLYIQFISACQTVKFSIITMNILRQAGI